MFADWEFNIGMGSWDVPLSKEEIVKRLSASMQVNRNAKTLTAFNFCHWSNISLIGGLTFKSFFLEAYLNMGWKHIQQHVMINSYRNYVHPRTDEVSGVDLVLKCFLGNHPYNSPRLENAPKRRFRVDTTREPLALFNLTQVPRPNPS